MDPANRGPFSHPPPLQRLQRGISPGTNDAGEIAHRPAVGFRAIGSSSLSRLPQSSIVPVREVLGGEKAVTNLMGARNARSRALGRDETVRVGLLYGDVSTAFFRELLTGCAEQADRSHAQLVMAKWTEGQPQDVAVKELQNMQVHGFILPPPLCESKRLHAAVRKLGVLAVTVASARPPTGLLAVNINDQAAAFAMTQHLLALGHRRIGFITGNPDQSASSLRLAGYKMALAQAGIPADELLVREGQFTYSSGLQAADVLLSLPMAPTAIFASNDDMAAATVAVAHRRHLEIPKDLSVCGFDDTERSRSMWPQLTTIRQPIADMSSAALSTLVKNLRGGPRDSHVGEPIVLDFTLIHRDSDGPPPTGRSGLRSVAS